MKRILLGLMMLTVILTTSCAKASTPEEIYTKTFSQLDKAGKIEMAYKVNAQIYAPDASISAYSYREVETLNNKEKVQFKSEGTGKANGRVAVVNSYLKDGFLYTDSNDEKIKSPVPAYKQLEQNFALSYSVLSLENLLDFKCENVEDEQKITFSLAPEKATTIVTGAAVALGYLDNLISSQMEFNVVEGEIILQKNKIASINIFVNYTSSYSDDKLNAVMQITYEINKLSNSTNIVFPDFSDYIDK